MYSGSGPQVLTSCASIITDATLFCNEKCAHNRHKRKERERERERDGCDLLVKSLCIVWDYRCCVIITKPTRAAELSDNHQAFSSRETDKPLQERERKLKKKIGQDW
jgi:hypothetical protein